MPPSFLMLPFGAIFIYPLLTWQLNERAGIDRTTFTAPYATITTSVHPLKLYNVQPIQATNSPLTYNLKHPSPSYVPDSPATFTGGAPARWFGSINDREDLHLIKFRRPRLPINQSPSIANTTQDATTITPSCTSYKPTITSAYPSLCAATLQANVASVVRSSGSIVQVKPSPILTKMDCCLACSNVLNCVHWSFTPNAPLKPWDGGSCFYALNTDTGPGRSYANTPTLCPNGVVVGLFGDGVEPNGREDAMGQLDITRARVGVRGTFSKVHWMAGCRMRM